LTAASRKSPKTSGGVILLEGNGPFQPFRRTDCRGIRIPGGELEIARRSFVGSMRGGDDERALGTATANGDARLSQVLADATG
jgi:hypothetical protein